MPAFGEVNEKPRQVAVGKQTHQPKFEADLMLNEYFLHF